MKRSLISKSDFDAEFDDYFSDEDAYVQPRDGMTKAEHDQLCKKKVDELAAYYAENSPFGK